MSHVLPPGLLLDDEDAIYLLQYRWRVGLKGDIITDVLVDGKPYTLRLHRLIMGCVKGDGTQVDHINRNRLDNRRTNLRVVTAQVNNENKGTYRNSTGGTCQQRNGRWQARVRTKGKLHALGTYDTQEQAQQVAAEFRESLRG